MIQLRISQSKKSNNQYGLIHFIKNTITKNNLQKKQNTKNTSTNTIFMEDNNVQIVHFKKKINYILSFRIYQHLKKWREQYGVKEKVTEKRYF